MEEVNLLHPRCLLFKMMVPCWSLNGFHKSIAKCKKDVKRKRQRLAVEEARVMTSKVFSAYGCPFEKVQSFKCLGIVLLVTDDDWPAVIQNLANPQMVWRRISRILSK